MPEDDTETSVEDQLTDLTRTLEQLQHQLERDRRPPFAPRPPRLSELRTFTSEVAIPGLVLLLETNVRALKLLQRTLRLAEEGEAAGSEATARANELGSAALDRLDDALADLQSALAGEPSDSEARELLADAQSLQEEIQDSLADGDSQPDESGPSVDVEAELQSIKDQVDDDDDEKP